MDSSKSYSLVEGEWKEFVFRRVTRKDYEAVLDNVCNYFMRDEPTCKLLGYTSTFISEMRPIVAFLLDDNLSFLAEHKETGEVAAVRINFRETKDSNFENMEMTDLRTDFFMNTIDLTPQQKDELTQRTGVNEYIEMFMISTAPQYRNRGLSFEFYQRCLKFFQAEGFSVIKCIFTSPTTRRTGGKLGFKEFVRIPYVTAKNRNGELMFKKEHLNEEHFASIMIKMLEK